MKQLSIILMCLALIGCAASSAQSDFLNGKEKDLLETIIVEFDELMKTNSLTENVPDAYTKFAEKLKFNESAADFENKVEEIQPGCHRILETLADEKGFDEIWALNYGFRDSKMKDTVSTMYDFNPNGSYFEFLKKRAERDSLFEGYYELVSSTISIPPSSAAGFPHVIKEFNLDREEDRLIIAIHYLTLLSHKEKSR